MKILDLGLIRYEDALNVQETLLYKRIEGIAEDTLILAEHLPVVTMGRTSNGEGLVDKRFFEENGIQVLSVGRGGKITSHGPGQLVMYPVISLEYRERDIRRYIDFLEKTVSFSLCRIGVPAERNPLRRGVWVRGRKIAFIGIAIKKWVTYHGVAININNDIIPFSKMNPCGESDIRVTSASDVLGHAVDMSFVRSVFAEQFTVDMEAEYAIEKSGAQMTG